MAEYQAKWHGVTKISWVKAHTEKGGAKTSAHEQQNKRVDDDAEKAYTHTDSPRIPGGYCSQFDTLKGAIIEGAHKMGPTVLRHLQNTHYLNYWRSRSGTGAWTDNADIEGHAAVYRRARKGNPQKPSCAQYKGMNCL